MCQKGQRCLQEKARPRSEAPKGGQSTQQATLEQLASKIIEVYQQSGFDRDASLSILQMLTNIEVRLMEMLMLLLRQLHRANDPIDRTQKLLCGGAILPQLDTQLPHERRWRTLWANGFGTTQIQVKRSLLIYMDASNILNKYFCIVKAQI